MQAQVIEGTTEEILTCLQEAYPNQTLRVTIEPQEEENLLVGVPLPPNTVRSGAQLIELLLQSLNSPRYKVTNETWEQRKAEVRRRVAYRQINLGQMVV